MLLLKLEAPFAVFRTFAAGSFRPTAGFITPSAAYGLLLNVAGIEMRHDDGKSQMTMIKSGLPLTNIAIAALEFPLQHSIYQQLHNYPVGENNKINDPEYPDKKITQKAEGARRCKGYKYNITPVRRSFMSNIKAYIAIKGNDELETWVIESLAGRRPRSYGLPFLGDNNFLVDRLEPVAEPKEASWFVVVNEAEERGVRDHITRLTITIDRTNMTNTRSALFAPVVEPCREIPEKAWVQVGC
jgi:CRISPR-associated protein Cas5t